MATKGLLFSKTNEANSELLGSHLDILIDKTSAGPGWIQVGVFFS